MILDRRSCGAQRPRQQHQRGKGVAAVSEVLRKRIALSVVGSRDTCPATIAPASDYQRRCLERLAVSQTAEFSSRSASTTRHFPLHTSMAGVKTSENGPLTNGDGPHVPLKPLVRSQGKPAVVVSSRYVVRKQLL